ncbi:hypothetical protein [Streptomyces sp. TLI_146]|uniref:hypothetical protein n=1 Tax=Streptomyces sp. TLI_146 TaxID=1938858 RepID=UPI000C706295|nr:hypothetical protein [Streptomyces sp. TLI_146]PKV90085.1 hypothetical protein BX283_7749 [Streptomyces sp. TLI_146]
MSLTRVLRGVAYRLLRHPDSCLTMTARCMSGDGCGWELGATTDLDVGGVEILMHTAETGHAIFTRTLEDIACVALTRTQERADRVRSPWPEAVTRQREDDVEVEHTRAET